MTLGSITEDHTPRLGNDAADEIRSLNGLFVIRRYDITNLRSPRASGRFPHGAREVSVSLQTSQFEFGGKCVTNILPANWLACVVSWTSSDKRKID